jgi:RimJ/RimL family protein N-acetyltransferase
LCRLTGHAEGLPRENHTWVLFSHDGSEIELGYVLASEWTQGYATEASAAVTAALEAGFWIYATIRSTNSASLRVADKLGHRPDGQILDERGTLLFFRLP